MVEKTDILYESFQKLFNMFLKSGNLYERINNFSELLKNTLQLESIHLVHKQDSGWKRITDNDNLYNVIFLHINLNFDTEYFEGDSYPQSITMLLSDSSSITILLGKKYNNDIVSDYDKIILHLLIHAFENEYNSSLNRKKEKDLIFSLNEKILQLNGLIDTGIELSKFDRRNILFDSALERACSLTNASSALIRVSEKNNSSNTHHFVFPAGTNPDIVTSSIFKIESGFEFNNKSYQFILSEKETRQGSTSFNELDEILLEAICKQVFVVIENESFQNQILHKQRLEQELNVAASIQQKIIPDKLPDIPGYSIAGINIPSREVGGDYYDCVDIGNGKYVLIIADVTGKGIAAALLVNTLNAALYSYLEFDLLETEMVSKLNKIIYNSSPSDKFITFFIAVLESKTGMLDVVNAGHNPILLFRKDGTLEKINAGGVGLGMFNLGLPFTGQKLLMNPGDSLFLYTDGIPEAMNINEEEYSDDRMIEFLKTHSDYSPEYLIKNLVKDVKQFAGTAEQSDDITALHILRQE